MRLHFSFLQCTNNSSATNTWHCFFFFFTLLTAKTLFVCSEWRKMERALGVSQAFKGHADRSAWCSVSGKFHPHWQTCQFVLVRCSNWPFIVSWPFILPCYSQVFFFLSLWRRITANRYWISSVWTCFCYIKTICFYPDGCGLFQDDTAHIHAAQEELLTE